MISQTNIAERIVLIAQELRLSVNEFALKLGYTRSQILYDVINGKSKPSFQFFDKLSKSDYAEIFSYEWIITGNGHMLKSGMEIRNSLLEYEFETCKNLCNTQKDFIAMQKKEIERLESVIAIFDDKQLSIS